MFSILAEVGPASWHVQNPRKSEEEELALLYIKQLQEGALRTKNEKELGKIMDHLWTCGKKAFSEKKFVLAELMFSNAIFCLPFSFTSQKKLSILHQNVALCKLKMDLPLEALPSLSHSLLNDYENNKANLLTIKVFYMMYNFGEAVRLVNYGLSVKPDLEDLHVMKKKLLTNKILENFPAQIIKQRVSKYMLTEPMKSVKLPDITPLLKSFEENSRDNFVKEEKKVTEKLITEIERLISTKNFYEAHQALVDWYYIMHTLQTVYQEKVDDQKLFLLFSKRGMCLYYMERYSEALECYHKANAGQLRDAESLTMEAKTLIKLNQFDEASKVINGCIAIVKPYSVEALICEEVLFDIQFEKEMKTLSTIKQDTNKDYEKVKEKTPDEDKNPKGGTTVDADLDSEVDVEFLVKVCRLCGVSVSGKWIKHVKSARHVELLKKNKSNGAKTTDATTQTEDVLYGFAMALDKYSKMPFFM